MTRALTVFASGIVTSFGFRPFSCRPVIDRYALLRAKIFQNSLISSFISSADRGLTAIFRIFFAFVDARYNRAASNQGPEQQGRLRQAALNFFFSTMS